MSFLLIDCCVVVDDDRVLSSHHKTAMITYLLNHQQTDGGEILVDYFEMILGWGLHIESPSTMFGSCLNYCALRLIIYHITSLIIMILCCLQTIGGGER